MRVRELVSLGLSRGQLMHDEVRGYEGGDTRSDEVTLAWFKNSLFAGEMGKLEFALVLRPKKIINRTFHSGAPEEGAVYSAEQKEQIRKLGKDPELLEKTRGSRNYTDWKARKGSQKAS